MTAHRNQFTLPKIESEKECSPGTSQVPEPLTRQLDVVKRDRFELLSAYLDGEVTPEERRLVLQWLEEDPTTQCLYQRLLHLRNSFHVLCQSSWSANAADATAQKVVDRLNHRFSLTCMAGFAALAVAVVGTLSGAIGGRPFGGLLQTAGGYPSDAPLEIALDQPVIPIPKTAVGSQPQPKLMDAELY